MKPVIGRPVNVWAPATGASIAGARCARCEVATEIMPRPAFGLVMVRIPQPFWKPEVTFTLVRFVEPSTVEAVVSAGLCGAPGLRIDSTVDSQHIEFAAPAGGSGEKSDPAATALASSRLKKVNPMSSQAPLAVSRFEYGGVAVTSSTNRFLSGWVRTQSVAEAEALSRMYSFITAVCMNTAATARAPAGAMPAATQSERYAVTSVDAPVPSRSPERMTRLCVGVASPRFGCVAPESV